MVVRAVGTVVDTERDIIVNAVPIITPNGDVIVSSLTFKVHLGWISARGAQAKLALIVAQCLSIHLSICVSVHDSLSLWELYSSKFCSKMIIGFFS